MMTRPEDWRPHGISDLEPAAWEALRAGTASVAAGPGAGKTEFLAQRAGYLLETGLCSPPRRILSISFKRSAAANLRNRVRSRVPEHAHRFDSMTFDAFTKSIVDRFRALLPDEWRLDPGYRIGFSSVKEVQDFLFDIAGGLDDAKASSVRGLSASTFLPNGLGATPLPSVPSCQPLPGSASEYAVQEWWARKYLGVESPVLDFVMLNRLAELIIRESGQLRRALRLTYPFVFIDEFQDTTYAQYSFLRSVFSPDATTVTAVGDRKQRIMGWAGALDDAFEQFESDFGADPFELTFNFRSTQQLVDLQHRFAVRLDHGTVLQQSRIDAPVDESAIQVWSFKTRRQEADTLAEWIADDMRATGRSAADYALIARQEVADLQPEFERALSRVGLRLRNDAAKVGELMLQDLLNDDLVQLLLGILAVAVNRGGQPRIWREVTETLSRVRSDRRGAGVETETDDELTDFVKGLRRWSVSVPTGRTVSADRIAAIAEMLTDKLTAFVRTDTAGQKRLFGDRPQDAAVTLEAFRVRLAETLGRVDSWAAVFDGFLDREAVALQTVHRSKGLEYSTVFFVGLDSRQWWAHPRDEIASTMTFFVGVSRAAERLFFTQCDERGSFAPLGSLYRDMENSGVSIRRFE